MLTRQLGFRQIDLLGKNMNVPLLSVSPGLFHCDVRDIHQRYQPTAFRQINRMTAYAAGDIERAPHIFKVRRDELLVSADKERIGRVRVVRTLGVTAVPFDAGILFHSFLELSDLSCQRSQQTLFALRFSQDSPCRLQAITLAKSEKRIAKSGSSKQMRIIRGARVDVDLFLGVPAGVPAGLYPELRKHGVRATCVMVARVVVLGPSILQLDDVVGMQCHRAKGVAGRYAKADREKVGQIQNTR